MLLVRLACCLFCLALTLSSGCPPSTHLVPHPTDGPRPLTP